MSDAQAAAGWRRVQSGIQILAWAWVARGALYIVDRFVWMYLFAWISRVSDGSTGLFQVVSGLFQAAFVSLDAAMLLGVLRLGAIPDEERVVDGEASGTPYRAPQSQLRARAAFAPRLVMALAILWGVDLVLGVADLGLEQITSSSKDTAVMVVNKVIWGCSLAADLAAEVALLLWIQRAARRLGARLWAPLPAGVLVLAVARTALALLRLLGQLRGERFAWVSWASMAIALTLFLGFFALLSRLRRAARDASEAEAAKAPVQRRRKKGKQGLSQEQEAAWFAAAEGLDRYRAALSARIAVLLGGYALMLVVGAAQNMEAVKLLIVLLPACALIIGIVMIVGLYRFAKVPLESGGADLAIFALVLIAVGALCDLFSLSLVLDLLSDRPSRAFVAMEQIPYVEMASQAATLVGLMTLLASFRRVARYINAPEVADRVTGLSVLLVLVLVGVIAVRLMISERMLPSSAVMVLVIPVLVVAVVTVLRYLNLVRDLHAALVRYRQEAEGA